MNLLRNFTIRRVMLIVLILFCLLWSAVGSYSLWTLSRIAQSQRNEGPLVAQIQLINQGSERYLTLLNHSGDARQNLDALRDGLAAFRQIAPAPALAEAAADAAARWQALLDDGASGAGSRPTASWRRPAARLTTSHPLPASPLWRQWHSACCCCCFPTGIW